MSEENKIVFESIKYPIPLLQSYIGNLLYTTSDIFDDYINDDCLCQLNISDITYKDFNNIPINELQKISTRINKVITYRHNSNSKISCTTEGLVVDSNGGRKILTISDYINRIAIDKPKAIIALVDEIPYQSTSKRIVKSKQRSTKWLNVLLDSSTIDKQSTFIFGPIFIDRLNQIPVGEQAVKLLDRVNGLFISSSCFGEPEERLHKSIAELRSSISSTIPILVQGVESIINLLKCIKNGASIISSNIPLALTQAGRAWSLKSTSIEFSILDSDIIDSYNNLLASSVDIDDDNDIDDNNNSNIPKKRPRLNGNDESIRSNIKSNHLNLISINLWDEKYKADSRPLLEGCQCLACRHHSKAYIHHLLLAHELLSEILLYNHNQHNFIQLFKCMSSVESSVTNQLMDQLLAKLL